MVIAVTDARTTSIWILLRFLGVIIAMFVHHLVLSAMDMMIVPNVSQVATDIGASQFVRAAIRISVTKMTAPAQTDALLVTTGKQTADAVSVLQDVHNALTPILVLIVKMYLTGEEHASIHVTTVQTAANLMVVPLVAVVATIGFTIVLKVDTYVISVEISVHLAPATIIVSHVAQNTGEPCVLTHVQIRVNYVHLIQRVRSVKQDTGETSVNTAVLYVIEIRVVRHKDVQTAA